MRRRWEIPHLFICTDCVCWRACLINETSWMSQSVGSLFNPCRKLPAHNKQSESFPSASHLAHSSQRKALQPRDHLIKMCEQEEDLDVECVRGHLPSGWLWRGFACNPCTDSACQSSQKCGAAGIWAEMARTAPTCFQTLWMSRAEVVERVLQLQHSYCCVVDVTRRFLSNRAITFTRPAGFATRNNPTARPQRCCTLI